MARLAVWALASVVATWGGTKTFGQTEIWSHVASGVLVDDFAVVPGDIDQDGVKDIAYFDESNHLYAMISGATGAQLAITPLAFGEFSVATMPGDARFRPLGDVDGDGDQDVWLRTTAGERIVDALSGSQVWVTPPGLSVLRAFDPKPLGDLDGDGATDLLFRVQLMNGDFGLLAYSVASNTSLYSVFPFAISATSRFGATTSLLGDLDGDGVSEVAAADSRAASGGEVVVFSGQSGVILTSILAPVGVNRAGTGTFGCRLCPVGDADGDGLTDLGVYEAAAMGPGSGWGLFFVYSMPGGALISTRNWPGFPAPSTAGLSSTGFFDCSGVFFTPAGDVDADGIGDFIVDGARTDGAVPSGIDGNIVNGADGSLMRVLVPFFGPTLELWRGGRPAIDLNGDGLSELLVWRRRLPSPTNPIGAALILALVDPTADGLSVFGEGCAGGGGEVPRIGASVDRPAGAVAVGDSLTVRLSRVPAQHLAHLVVGGSNTQWGPEPLPLIIASLPACDLRLLVRPDFLVPRITESFGVSGGRAAVEAGVIPAGMAGATIHAQWIVENPLLGGVARFSTSAGLALEL